MQQVEIVVSAVRAALAETGIDKPGDVHFVQVKCPLLTAQRVGEAAGRGGTLATSRHAPINGSVAGGTPTSPTIVAKHDFVVAM